MINAFELPAETKAATGFTHKIVFDHTDLTTAADNTAQVLTLLTVPARSIIRDAAIHVVTPLELAGTTAYNSNNVSVGITGTLEQLVANTQSNANSGSLVRAARFASNTPVLYTAATPIVANVASMASYDLLELTAGEIHVFLDVVTLTNL